MIVETVTFNIKPGMTRAEVLEDARTTIDRWRGFPGLDRKAYVMVDANTARGIYFWQTLADAERGHDAAWLDRAEVHWGNRPVIERHDTLMILDNRHDEILEYPPQRD